MSCQDDNINLFDDLTDKGGFVAFKSEPTLSFNFLKLAEAEINEEIIDVNNNITSYVLSVTHEDVTVDNFITITKFPANLVITLPMLYEAFNITEADLSGFSEFEFNAVVTTPNAIYNGIKPDFNTDTNEAEGGTTISQLLGDSYRNALAFNFSFIIPPPKKIRGTSFEEGSVGSGTYIRPDGQDARDEGPLINNPPISADIMYTAVGTGVDDEIGFTAEYIQLPFQNGVGGPSGTDIGISNYTDDVGAYPDGEQGYRLQNTRGIVKLAFDRVAVPSGVTDSGVQIKLFINGTGFDDDNLRNTPGLDPDYIIVSTLIERTDGSSETMVIFDKSGDELDDLGESGKFTLISTGFLTDVSAYTLMIEFRSTSSSERAYFDQMLVFQPSE
ncbi:hypothetical protein C1H87_10550 [Flavivirga eckloniae]|uniref:Uncharacterized protein n=2 Tax=Flavivirga eckloniae TaxID=1803846 RepID=A0A2K9PPZ2_9FLAO|nr:hypothetical protein C1H87_10550 [Flavivirga eckloniae]